MNSVSTIVTQFGEYVIYENLSTVGIRTNWEDAEIDEESGTIKPTFEMIGRDVSGIDIPMGSYETYEDAQKAMADLHEWLAHKAYSVFEMSAPQGADT